MGSHPHVSYTPDGCITRTFGLDMKFEPGRGYVNAGSGEVKDDHDDEL